VFAFFGSGVYRDLGSIELRFSTAYLGYTFFKQDRQQWLRSIPDSVYQYTVPDSFSSYLDALLVHL
jgi:hypothetical protein